MEIMDHIVEFDKHCKTCKYKDVKQDEEPCTSCLGEPVLENSRKPLYYEADEKLVEAEAKKAEEEEKPL